MEMGSLLPDNTWSLVTSGPDYAVWESSKKLPSLPLNLKDINEIVEETPTHPIAHMEPHPVKVTKKMSQATKKRILEEASDVVGKSSRVEKSPKDVQKCKDNEKKQEDGVGDKLPPQRKDEEKRKENETNETVSGDD